MNVIVDSKPISSSQWFLYILGQDRLLGQDRPLGQLLVDSKAQYFNVLEILDCALEDNQNYNSSVKPRFYSFATSAMAAVSYHSLVICGGL